MPKIEKTIAQGFSNGELYDMLVALKNDLAEIKAKYENHRHSVAGAEGTGTAPSTGAAAADETASIINLKVTS